MIHFNPDGANYEPPKELEKSVELTAMLEIAKQAAELVMSHYQEETKYIKILDDPKKNVTAIDYASNDLILAELKKRFPDYGFLSEETPDDGSRLQKDKIFIIDPLDGTKKFVNKSGDFAINIAYVEKGRPVAGVMVLPAKKQTFYAEKDKGTHLIEGGKERQIKLDQEQELENARLIYSKTSSKSGYFDRLMANKFANNEPDPGGSLGHKMAQILLGEKDFYFRMGKPCGEWDIATSDILINEAGGKFTNYKNQPLQFNKPNPTENNFAVGNNKIHERVLRIVKGLEK